MSVAHWRAEAKNTLQTRVSIMLTCLAITIFLGVTQGALKIDIFSALSALHKAVIWDVRAPRVLMTVVTGAGLAMCGLILQALSRNPLADPGLIGVSSFAALFASVAIFISVIVQLPDWAGLIFVPAMAFFGAALALALLLAIAGYKQSVNTLVLILTGVALNAGATTLLGLVLFMADDETLRVITFWQLGSYSGISWLQSLITLLIVCCASAFFMANARSVMLMQMGEQHARFQGVPVDRLKRLLLILVALVTAISVCFTGIVGFIGLVVPHITRMIVGANLVILLPCSMIVGASLVTLADVASRLLVVPAELPIGLLTSALGVPFFLGLILREKKKFAHD